MLSIFEVKMKKVLIIFSLSLILSNQAIAETIDIYKNYGRHIAKIGVIETVLGSTIVENAKQITNLTVSEDIVAKFSTLTTALKQCLKEHEIIEVPDGFYELHSLWSKILKEHSKAFDNLYLGLKEKNTELIDVALDMIKKSENDMAKIQEIQQRVRGYIE